MPTTWLKEMPAMSCSVEVDEVKDLEFKWKKKRGVGGKKKEVQFYESFTYDGLEYNLYDCVYLYKEGEPEPYIGKLVKIWELPDKAKKVKILWFFRPSEISNYLGNEETPWNELFLASGEGSGLTNVNPLEAIAGKCNVICTSKDSRNAQPSEEELLNADYIFYRTFDVGHLKISDKIDEIIAGIQAKFIFNREECQNPCSVPKLDLDGKEGGGNAVVSNEGQLLSKKNYSEYGQSVNRDRNSSDFLAKEDANVNGLLVRDFLCREKPGSGGDAESRAIIQTNVKEENYAGDRITWKIDSDTTKDKASKQLVKQDTVEERVESAKELSDLYDRPLKKERVDSTKESGDDTSLNIKKVKYAKDSGDEGPLKKAKIDSSIKVISEEKRNSLHKSSIDSCGIDVKAPVGTLSENSARSNQVKHSPELGDGPSKRLKFDEDKQKFSNGNLQKAASGQSADEGKQIDGQLLEVTRRPDADSRRWFRGPPWEERMETAYKQGSLVLLQNLDPACSSAEVEDIIWHGFKVFCTAKMIQRTAMSSPHSGQAFVIFKTRSVAEMVVGKLEEGCLMLSNGRPLVASIGTLCFPEKQSSFNGHLVIDKAKLAMQRGEMKQAVSTSHCSQPNTIEYEMAMEWCLLLARSDQWWRKLYKQHGEELRKLKTKFKSK